MMKPLLPDEIRRIVRGRWMSQHKPLSVSSVTTDTRHAEAGDLFIALRGERFDGHQFLVEAGRALCVAAIVCRDAEVPPEVAGLFRGGIIGVEDTTVALGELAAWCRSQSSAGVIGVTGSNGKTTVKQMIHAILSSRLRGTSSPKSYNNEIGVPLTLYGVSPGDDYVVCELGTNHPGEIANLSRIARPDVAVITSVGEAHLAGLGSIEKIAAEKASILDFVPRDGLGVVWADSEILSKAVRPYGCRVVRFGLSDRADLRLTGWESQGRGQRFQINSHLWVDLPLSGRHNAINALAAIAVARRFGFDQTEAAEALRDFEPVEMRMQWIDTGKLTLINDAYNANPASVIAAVDVLADCRSPRKVLILGDMGELGSRSEQLHRSVGCQVASRDIDLLITVGTMGRYIAKAADESGMESVTFDSVDQAARDVCSLLKQGDTVLIKASRAVGLESLIETITTNDNDQCSMLNDK